MDKDRHAAGKHVINRRDVRSSNTNLGLEFAVLGLCCLAGAVGIYTEDVRLTALIFLGGLGAWLMQGLPAALKGTAAAAKHKKAQVQGSLAVPPDQLLQLLKGRRSVAPKDYTGAKVDRAAIELCLEAARWAPTHNLTQPWRFVVLEGEAKTKFETLTIDLVGQYTTPADKSEEAVSRLKGKASKTWPLVSHYIVICMQPKSSEKSGKKNPEWEEIAAVSCAVQNLALMATAQGLAGYWSSWQAAARDAPEMAAFLGIDPTQGDKCLGVYSLGLSDRLAGYKGSRAPIADKTSWLS
ncbi:Nitroreductase-like protein [Haematococcus lacustris]